MSNKWAYQLSDIVRNPKPESEILIAQENPLRHDPRTNEKISAGYRYCIVPLYELRKLDFIHEVIYRDRPHKFFMDLDGTGVFTVKRLIGILNTIVSAFWNVYNLELYAHEIMVFSSSLQRKISYHLIVPKYFFRGLSVKKLAQWVTTNNNDAARLADMGVYTSLRLLRMYQKSKRSDPARIKRSEFHYEEHGVPDFPEMGPAGAQEFAILKASLVTYTHESVFGAEEMPPPRAPLEGLAGEEELMRVAEGVNTEMWTPELSETGLYLRRLCESYCDLCHREHQNDNASLTVIHGRIFFYCFRARTSLEIRPNSTVNFVTNRVSPPAAPQRPPVQPASQRPVQPATPPASRQPASQRPVQPATPPATRQRSEMSRQNINTSAPVVLNLRVKQTKGPRPGARKMPEMQFGMRLVN